MQRRVGQLPLEVGVLSEQRLHLRGVVAHASLLVIRLNVPTRTAPEPDAGATDRAPLTQLVVGCGLLAGVALAVALLEAGHAAAAVENLLLAGVEGVALGADLDVDLAALLRAASGEGGAAAAVHRRLDVVRVHTRFHGFLFNRGPRV